MARVPGQWIVTHKGLKVYVDCPELHDAEELLDVSRKVVDKSPYLLSETHEFKYTVEQERTIIQIYLDHPRELLLAARAEGKIIGMISFKAGFRRKMFHQGEFGMSIIPEYYRMGVGQVLLKALIDWVTDHPELEQIRLQVFKRNEAALALYKRNDFTLEGTFKNAVKYLDGTYDDILCMVLQCK